MHIERRFLIKWCKITALCGAHSFFWGFMMHASWIAMLLGMFTLALMFAAIDSLPAYQARRASHLIFARAMDLGVKIRIWLAFYIAGSYLFLESSIMRPEKGLSFLTYPYLGEILIGASATKLTYFFTGISSGLRSRMSFFAPSNLVATYIDTILTGLMHTAVLALLIGIVYAVLKLKNRRVIS